MESETPLYRRELSLPLIWGAWLEHQLYIMSLENIKILIVSWGGNQIIVKVFCSAAAALLQCGCQKRKRNVSKYILTLDSSKAVVSSHGSLIAFHYKSSDMYASCNL